MNRIGLGRTRTLWAVAFCVSLAIGYFGASQRAEAVTFTPDTLLGSADLASSSDAAELAALAGLIGVDPGSLQIVEKNEDPVALMDDAGNWYIDVAPTQPFWFILKFGIGPGNDDHFFFANIAELTKIVWTNAQIQGLMENCVAPTSSQTCRLSHYTTVVPLPGGIILFGTALAGMGYLGRRRRRTA